MMSGPHATLIRGIVRTQEYRSPQRGSLRCGQVAVAAMLVASHAFAGWTDAGTMYSSHFESSAVVLRDGRVLMEGGSTHSGTGYVSVAEVYDVSLRAWTRVADLPQPRGWHTSALLPNGTVLVIGGGDSTGCLKSVDQYNPWTDAWLPAVPMLAPMAPTATVLTDGRVFVADDSCGTAHAEVYDPASDAWADAGEMSTVRTSHTATLLPDGDVLLVGGESSTTWLASAERYNPSTNSWTSAGSMSTPRLFHTATLLPNGKVLVVGGNWYGNIDLASAEVYDPASNTWSLVSPMPFPRLLHTATLLPSGQVLVAGGDNSAQTFYPTNSQLYDAVTDTWTDAGDMLTPRAIHSAALLWTGQVLVAGGDDSPTGLPTSSELYGDPLPDAGPPDAGTWDAGAADAGYPDAGAPDAGPPDAGSPDAGTLDAGAPDAGTPDASTPDSGPPDAGFVDAGPPDSGPPDAGPPDAGRGPAADAGTPDAGLTDAGTPLPGWAGEPVYGCGCQEAGASLPWIGLLLIVVQRMKARRGNREHQ